MAFRTEDIPTVLLRATSLLVFFVVANFLYNGYKVRMRFRALKAQGIPIMPHSLLWGHLRLLGEYRNSYPLDNSSNHLSIWLVEKWETLFPGEKNCPVVMYLDVWPAAEPVIFTTHPKVSAQFTQVKSLPKSQMELDYLRPLTQNKDMVSSDGEYWKRWRSVFNPGFSSRNITALIPSMVDDMLTFVNVLESYAERGAKQGQVVQLEKLTTNLTFDIIGKATLDLKLNEQSGKSSILKTAMTTMTKRLGTRFSLTRTLAMLNPWSQLHQDNRVMREVLIPQIERYLHSLGSVRETKTIMDLAASSLEKESNINDIREDPEFLTSLLENLKAFLFAGHDTTATTICWLFKLLEENPECMDRVRHEHNEILGPNPADATELITKSPHVLNSMPYTMGCIKETLRLYTPASTARAGQAGFFLSDPMSNLQYPTEGFSIGDGSQGGHYRPDVWPRPREFMPERWLVKDGDPLFPMKDAWRPFQQGPRNCIGQELALMELKLVLVFCARTFDIEQAWDEWDRIRHNTGPKDMVNGERLYMVGDGTGHTKDETPNAQGCSRRHFSVEVEMGYKYPD
ncbi:uncharacterized protein JN550_009488 [Neoarthrinium moseri]|uniref:uncharacterized protein n=1 Tax=Neoarthrinium moseri TaxID=1658444 RepID=UPI001FDC78C3|nr:uncharacterized protein JN550_009488 [Neoarthrinium moseri]KAI1863377.1 hypothetical protein JN550_009488 [Neoarthrinium moseri]